MTIVVASGKGGTGKTTVSLALAQAAARPQGSGSDPAAGAGVRLLDCDVEAPNAHLFLGNGIEPTGTTRFSVAIPEIDPARCTGCGACAKFCAFGALAVVKGRVLRFDELCHSCGGCALVCPEGAIREVPREIGSITEYSGHGFAHIYGELDVGETLAPPLIRAVKSGDSDDRRLTIIDAPPGTTCPVVESAKGADVGVLVTENTPFGLHDLALAAEVFGQLHLPAGVVVNRSGIGYDNEDELMGICDRFGLPILARIPYSDAIARGYACGRTILESDPSLMPLFSGLLNTLEQMAERRPAEAGGAGPGGR